MPPPEFGRRRSTAEEIGDYGDGGDGDVRDAPEHWLNVINLEPTQRNLQDLADELGQRPAGWIDEYIELRGVVALMDLLELLEKRTSKKPGDFQLMDQVLRCLRSLMNLERGMNAILGLNDDANSGLGTPRGRGGASHQLQQIAMCTDIKHDSADAKAVQCQALTLLSAAALFSEQGHDQVLAPLWVVCLPCPPHGGVPPPPRAGARGLRPAQEDAPPEGALRLARRELLALPRRRRGRHARAGRRRRHGHHRGGGDRDHAHADGVQGAAGAWRVGRRAEHGRDQGGAPRRAGAAVLVLPGAAPRGKQGPLGADCGWGPRGGLAEEDGPILPGAALAPESATAAAARRRTHAAKQTEPPPRLRLPPNARCS